MLKIRKIDYSKDPKKTRWPRLMSRLKKLPRQEREAILLAATKYREGEDSCNSVYMGGMAHASLRAALGDSYPGSKPYESLIPKVSDETLEKGIWAAIHTIEFMLANPRKRCPCCGQVVPA